MDFEVGIDRLDQPHKADVLHDRRVDAEIDRIAEEQQRVDELGRLDEDVEREVDPSAAFVGDAAGLAELIQGELRALVARVEARRSHVDGVGAIRDRGANGIERSGG